MLSSEYCAFASEDEPECLKLFWKCWLLSLGDGFFVVVFGFGVLGGRAECRVLVSRAGIEPMPPAVEARSLNHWTTREAPR